MYNTTGSFIFGSLGFLCFLILTVLLLPISSPFEKPNRLDNQDDDVLLLLNGSSQIPEAPPETMYDVLKCVHSNATVASRTGSLSFIVHPAVDYDKTLLHILPQPAMSGKNCMHRIHGCWEKVLRAKINASSNIKADEQPFKWDWKTYNWNISYDMMRQGKRISEKTCPITGCPTDDHYRVRRKEVYKYWSDTLLVIHAAPHRYKDAPIVLRHYKKWFPYILFTGSECSTGYNVSIVGVPNGRFSHERDIYRLRIGEGQQFFLASIMNNLLLEPFSLLRQTYIGGVLGSTVSPEVLRGVEENIKGIFFIHDDLLLLPWMPLLYGFNKRIPWYEGNIVTYTQPNVPAFTFPRPRYWNRVDMHDQENPRAFARLDSADTTHLLLQKRIDKFAQKFVALFKNSMKGRIKKNSTLPSRAICLGGINDYIYIPRWLGRPFRAALSVFQPNLVFQEYATQTALFVAHPQFELMQAVGVYNRFNRPKANSARACLSIRKENSIVIDGCLHNGEAGDILYGKD